jgi:dihydroflavonol-4-reductase
LKKLAGKGHKVYALNRSKNSNDEFEKIGVTSIQGDLFDDSLKDRLFNLDIDAIFHVAGVNQMCAKNPSHMFKTNIEGTKSMLALGNYLKIKKFVYTSSAVTLGEEHGTVGSESSEHRGTFLSKYEESKYLAEKEAFKYTKDFEFVSINPSSVQGPGRVSGTAKLLISTLRKKYPPLIKNNISIIDIDDCTEGHYKGLLKGKDNERYVLNSFYLQSYELVDILKSITDWQGSPIYIPKSILKIVGPIGDCIKLFSSSPPFICSESIRVLTNGHLYDGSKAKKELGVKYIKVEDFIKKTVNWLIDEKHIALKKI